MATRVRRSRWITVSVSLVLIGLLLVAVLNVHLVGKAERIPGAFDGLASRPPEAPGLTVLMVGTIPGGAEHDASRADVPWVPGSQSLESVVLVEIAEDRRHVEVLALPVGAAMRAAVAEPAASTIVAAVEAWSGRRVDQLLALDWTALESLARERGSSATYEVGSGLPDQLAFLRTVVTDSLEAELRREPLALYRALSTTASGAAIDEAWSLLDLDRLVISLRNLRTAQITYGRAVPRH